MSEFYCADEAAMADLGATIAGGLPPGEGLRFHLAGELGAGKTTLVRGVLRGLGHTGRVKSPTYGLVENYEIGANRVCHFDLYRLAHPEELEFLGWRDLIDGPVVAFFEWPERACGSLGEADVRIEIAYRDEGRQVTIEPHTEAGRRWFERMASQDSH